jgi:hypothetical protein
MNGWQGLNRPADGTRLIPFDAPEADIRQFTRHDRKVSQPDSCIAANGIAIRLNVNSRLDRDLYSIDPLHARTTSLCPLRGGDLFAIRDRRRAPSFREGL